MDIKNPASGCVIRHVEMAKLYLEAGFFCAKHPKKLSKTTSFGVL
jgi:hypothetical protein